MGPPTLCFNILYNYNRVMHCCKSNRSKINVNVQLIILPFATVTALHMHRSDVWTGIGTDSDLSDGSGIGHILPFHVQYLFISFYIFFNQFVQSITGQVFSILYVFSRLSRWMLMLPFSILLSSGCKRSDFHLLGRHAHTLCSRRSVTVHSYCKRREHPRDQKSFFLYRRVATLFSFNRYCSV